MKSFCSQKEKKKTTYDIIFSYIVLASIVKESHPQTLLFMVTAALHSVCDIISGKRTLVVKGWGRGWQFALHDLTEMLPEGSSVLPRDSFYGLEINTLGKTRLQKRIQNYKYEIRSRAWKGPQWVKGLEGKASGAHVKRSQPGQYER